MTQRYFSKSTIGFYLDVVHGDNMPGDAVPISEATYQTMMNRPEGKVYGADSNGGPIWVDPPPPTDEELAASARTKRDALLLSSDWVTLRATETGSPIPADWITYREALRDVPEQSGFPQTITWPSVPV